MTIDFDVLFGRVALAFHAANVAHTATLTTIPAEVEDYVQAVVNGGSQAIVDTVANVPTSPQAAENGAVSMVSTLASSIQSLVSQTVLEDGVVTTSALAALRELKSQMEAESESLDASAVSLSISYDGGNVGTGVLVASPKRADGLVNQFAFDEDVTFTVQAGGTVGAETAFITSPPEVSNRLSPRWPGGSGRSTSIFSVLASNSRNLIPGGTFETNDADSIHLPTGWIVGTATLGTTVKMTLVEQQTIVISSTPTSGYYVLNFTDRNSIVQTTEPIAYNAAGSVVQTELRKLVGLANVTVSTSGSSPNYTHTVTFTGVPNPGELTSTSAISPGSIAHATTVAGSANVVRGARALELDSDGSQNTTFYIPVSLSPATQYALCSWIKADVVPAAGTLIFELVNGIGGSVIADDQSASNAVTIDATALSTSYAARTTAFRTPTILPSVVYLRMRIGTDVSAGTSLFLDEIAMVAMQELYAGGPFVALFGGVTDWATGDVITLAVTNDRGGAIHEWLDRVYDLRRNGILMPTKADGSETIADSLIA